MAERGASRLAGCQWDVWDACDAWDNGFLKLAMRKAKVDAQRCRSIRRKAHRPKPKPFALTAMCKARAESQRLLTIGASNKLAPILEKNRIDN